jgi:hypothetical protein
LCAHPAWVDSSFSQLAAIAPVCVKTASKVDGVCFRPRVENSLKILGMVREGFLFSGQK